MYFYCYLWNCFHNQVSPWISGYSNRKCKYWAASTGIWNRIRLFQYFRKYSTSGKQLISFSGLYQDKKGKLTWEAEKEINFNKYEIERSVNGTEFSTVGVMLPFGDGEKHVYKFSDNLSGVNSNLFYYRLRMVDIDSKFTYSKIITLRTDEKNTRTISVIPNPVTNGNAVIKVNALSNEVGVLRVVDITGRIVITQKVNLYQGTNVFPINELQKLKAGIYNIRLASQGTKMNSKFVVNP